MTQPGSITGVRGNLPRTTWTSEGAAALLPSVLMLCAMSVAPLALSAAETPVPAGTGPGNAVPATAASLLAEAQAASAAGRLHEAQDLLLRAAQIAPENLAIQTESARIATVLSGTSVPTLMQPAVLTDWARAEIAQARNRAEIMVRSGRFEDAAEQLTVVRQNIIARRLDSDATVADGIAAIDLDLQRLNEQRAAAAAVADQATRAGILDRANDRAAAERVGGEALLRERMRRITDLREHGHLELALSEARALVDANGGNPQVRELYRDVLADAHRQRQLTTDQQSSELRQELNERISRSMIPEGLDGMPIYPDGWLARPRGVSALSSPAEPAWKDAIRDTLRARISLDVDAQNGIDVLTALAAANHLNLVIDPSLAAGAELTVTMHAPSISLENAVSWLCRQMGTSWSLTKGAVWIGPPPDDTDSPLAVYDIQSLVAGALDQPGKLLDIAGSGASGTGGASFTKPAEPVKVPTTDEVVDLIKASISPETWQKNGNGITIRGTQLFVNAPASIHHLIAEFIRSQEQAHSLLVKVDARWLTLEDDFLEEIGVDWAVTPSSLLAFPGFASGMVAENPNSTVVGSVINRMPSSASAASAGAATRGMTIGWSFLGTVQLSAVLHATESNTRSRVLSAPMLTTVNGVRSSLFVGSQTAYISDYSIVSSNLDPTISVLNTGIALDIRPLVSADHKYITMDFRPAVTSVKLFTEFISALRTNNGVPFDGNVLIPGFQPPLAVYPLELPNVTIREAGTTLTIPDRGSALIGGFGRAIDEQTEARIPFLGDIPYLGRLFGRRGRYSEHENLYLLATLTIISYDEQEAKL